MDNILPELLLHIFELTVHTPHEPNPSFPCRGLVLSQAESNDTSLVKDHWAQRDDQYPDFPSGITSHETNPHTPLNLSHVCKRWRTLAFAEPSLWSTIYVTDGKEGLRDLLKLWLDRSRSRPLKIVFRDGFQSTPGEGKEIVAMLSLAAAHSRRWKSFKVRLRHIHLPMQAMQDSLKAVDTPNLQTLAFSFDGTLNGDDNGMTADDMFMERWTDLMRSPKLDEIQMWDTMDHDSAFLSAIPFSRLVAITLPVVSVVAGDRFISNLSRCTNLHTLSVSLDACWYSSTLYTMPIPTLRNLDIIVYPGLQLITADAFLQVFHLPALQHLSIHTETLSCGPGGLALASTLQHWKSKLTSLQLRTEQSFQDYPLFASLLAHPALSTLRHLRIGGIGGVADTFHLLTINDDRQLLPQLQHIYIESLQLNGDYAAPANMALSWSMLKQRPLLVEADFLEAEDFTRATECWERCANRSLDKVDKKFRWIGKDTRILEREFMIRDFSMIQGWIF